MAAEDERGAEEQAQIRVPSAEAFVELLPAMDALPAEKLMVPTMDIMSVISIVLGAVPRLRLLRPEVVRQLVTFDVARFDRLELHAKALQYANARFRVASAEKVNLVKMASALTVIRDRLLVDARSLASHELLDMESLKGCGKTPGYEALAADMALLLTLFKERWPSLRRRTPVTVESLNDANDRVEDLLAALASQDGAPLSASEAEQRQRRAFTLLARAYKDARAAAAYLRWQEYDAEEIAPSIFVGEAPLEHSELGREADEGGSATAHASNAKGQTDVMIEPKKWRPISRLLLN